MWYFIDIVFNFTNYYSSVGGHTIVHLWRVEGQVCGVCPLLRLYVDSGGWTQDIRLALLGSRHLCLLCHPARPHLMIDQNPFSSSNPNEYLQVQMREWHQEMGQQWRRVSTFPVEGLALEEVMTLSIVDWRRTELAHRNGTEKNNF